MTITSFILTVEDEYSDTLLCRSAATHFGPYAGYVQQYLFHYVRTKLK